MNESGRLVMACSSLSPSVITATPPAPASMPFHAPARTRRPTSTERWRLWGTQRVRPNIKKLHRSAAGERAGGYPVARPSQYWRLMGSPGVGAVAGVVCAGRPRLRRVRDVAWMRDGLSDGGRRVTGVVRVRRGGAAADGAAPRGATGVRTRRDCAAERSADLAQLRLS